ncbi:MAG: hypothetical protein ACTSP5_00305 [Candidatus Heimdallarchaeota archaeon]
MSVGKPKVVVVSHTLPPSCSGQAIMIHRIFKNFPEEKYSFISTDIDFDSKRPKATKKLPGRYFYLKPPIKLSPLHMPRLGFINTIKSFFRNFFMMSITILTKTYQITRILKNEKASLVISCTANLPNIPAAFLASKITRTHFVPYIFDDFAYQTTGAWRLFSRVLEKYILKRSSNIIVTNEYMQAEYLKRYGVASTIIHNPTTFFEEKTTKEKLPFSKNKVNIVYTGAIYSAQIDALYNLVQGIIASQRTNIELHLYTDTSLEILKKHHLIEDFVKYHEHVSSEKIPYILTNAQILFLPLAFDSHIPEVIRSASPGKMGDYLASEGLILVNAPADSFINWYFTHHKCGVVVSTKNPKELGEALVTIIDNKELQEKLRENAITQAKKDFIATTVRKDFVAFLKSNNEKCQ